MAGSTVVVHILGETRGLQRALLTARKDIGDLAGISQYATAAIGGIGMAFAATAAAGVASGAVAAAAVAGMTAAIGGGLIYFAAKNQEVKNSFKELKEHVSADMQDLTKGLVGPLNQFADQARNAFHALYPAITNISNALAPLITQIGDKLRPLAEQLGPMLESAFKAGEGPLLAFVDGLGPLIDGFKQFFDILNNPVISEFMSTFMSTLGQLLPILAQLLVALTPIGTEILVALVPAFQQLADFIIANVVPIMMQLTQFLTEHPGLITGLAVAWVAMKTAMIATNAAQALLLVGTVALTAVQRTIAIATGIWTAAQWLLSASMYGFPLVWIIAAVIAVIAIIVLLVQNWDSVTQFLSMCWEWIKQAAITAWNAIASFFVSIWNSIKDWCVNTFNSIKDWISNTWNSIKSTTSNVWNSIKSFISESWNNILNTTRNIIGNIKDTIVNKFNEVISWFGSLPGRFFSLGRNMIQGLLDGAGSLLSTIGSFFLSKLPGWIQGPFKAALGINSPSKVFAGYGENLGEGLIIGIKSEFKTVARASKQLGESALDVMPDKKFYDAGLTMGEQLAAGIKHSSIQVAQATKSLNAVFDNGTGAARLSFDAAVTSPGTGNQITVNVQAGISSPEETGRAVVDAIASFEMINGDRWRNN